MRNFISIEQTNKQTLGHKKIRRNLDSDISTVIDNDDANANFKTTSKNMIRCDQEC